MPARIRLEARPGPVRCSLCREPLEPTTARRCPACDTAYHEPCWQELAGCAVVGCARRARPAPGAEPPAPRAAEARRLSWLDVFPLGAGLVWVLLAFAWLIAWDATDPARLAYGPGADLARARALVGPHHTVARLGPLVPLSGLALGLLWLVLRLRRRRE